MYTKEKQEMQHISNYAGDRPDYVQGGGGNTSVKFDDSLMAIKASGYTLGEVTTDTGYVTVDYQKIKHYYNRVDCNAEKDFEKESLGVNLESIRLLDGMENKRPSVEVGFHSFLKKYVIHTHSIYANMLCCSEEGKTITKIIFKDADIGYLFIPYIDPGFRLTLAIKQAIEDFEKKNSIQPDVIFMENHGVIVHGYDADTAIALHKNVNKKIQSHFGIKGFPIPKVKKTAEGYVSDTEYLNTFIAKYNADEAYFNVLKLYPDQLVYIGSKLGTTVKIDNGQIAYNTSEKEAQVIEETLLGVVFVVDSIKKAGLTLREMDARGVNFINNWESEKYRSKIIK